MSVFVTTSEVATVLGRLRREQVMDLVRGATFVGALLLAWISLRPFADLGIPQFEDSTSGNEVPTYLAFGCLGALALTLALRESWRGLSTLLTPAFTMLGGWIVISVVLSQDPDTSVRRFALTVCVIAVAAAIMLLPKSQNELMRWFSVAALALLAACYLGVLLAPNVSIHLITDIQEPQLAGDWRGVFGHKNITAGVMAMLVFIGVYIVRSGAWLSGLVTILLSLIFLLNTAGKSALALTLVVLALSLALALVRSFWLRGCMLLTPLLMLNLFSVGTVMFDSVADLARKLPFDTSYTGRADIWRFAVQSLRLRLATGYGFSAFWGTDVIRNLPASAEWAEYASHSHNGYLDTALATGLPGLALLVMALVIGPLRNFQTAERGGNGGPLLLLLLQIWLFGLYLSSLESFFLDRADPLWFTFLLAVFGLHYLARFRLRE
ncbi:MAG: O-antigen ligase [Betaproteobacteria bacterium]